MNSVAPEKLASDGILAAGVTGVALLAASPEARKSVLVTYCENDRLVANDFVDQKVRESFCRKKANACFGLPPKTRSSGYELCNSIDFAGEVL